MVKVNVTDLHGGKPSVTPIDTPEIRAAVTALKKGFGVEPVFMKEGGSIPIVNSFKEILGADTVLLGFGLRVIVTLLWVAPQIPRALVILHRKTLGPYPSPVTVVVGLLIFVIDPDPL